MNENFDKEIKEIFLDEIIPNRFQPRLNFDQKSLTELADSIKQHGIIQPLVLRKLGEKYEIIAGERRYKASQLIGLVKVPAIVVDLDDNKSAEVAIVENLHRKDMTSFEEATAYKKLLERGITQEQLGARLGKSQSYIANKLRLLSLGENVRTALIEEKISERHGRSLLVIKDEDEQNKMLNEIISKRLTVKETDELIKKMYSNESEETNEIIEENNDIKIKSDDLIMDNVEETTKIEEIIEEESNNIEEIVEEESDNIEEIVEEEVDKEEQYENTDINTENIEGEVEVELQETNNTMNEEKPIEETNNQTQLITDNIMNFNLDNIIGEKPNIIEEKPNIIEEKPNINAPKPFIIIDPEPHNNKNINPQKELMQKISNVDSSMNENLFREASKVKSSPYVIPKTDITDNYLIPETSFQTSPQQQNIYMEKENNQRSFNIDQILGNTENQQQQFNPQSVPTQEQTEIEENQPQQNRFIVDLNEPAIKDKQDIENAKNMIKKIVEGIKNSGVKIDFEEFDFERLYQIIIKIDK